MGDDAVREALAAEDVDTDEINDPTEEFRPLDTDARVDRQERSDII